MADSFKYQGRRKRLIQELVDMGITDYRVLDAIAQVPRHLFVESAFADAAYENRALPIELGQTISQPFTVAYQSQLLEAKDRMKVLEIGTGSGYQAAVLLEMGLRVFSIEFHAGLHTLAKTRLQRLGYEIKLKHGDGALGWPTYQPYDRILVTAASPHVPPILKTQLTIGGRLVIPVGDTKLQTMKVIVRNSEEDFSEQSLRNFRFVPLLGVEGYK